MAQAARAPAISRTALVTPRQATDLRTMDDLLKAFEDDDSFAFSKINHGFWEALGDVEALMDWPATEETRARADAIAQRPHFFVGGFVDEFLELLDDAAEARPPSLHLAYELSAWPGDDRIVGTPFRPDRSRPVFERYANRAWGRHNGLLLKEAVTEGTIVDLFRRLADHHVIVVGPDHLEALFSVAGLDHGRLISIHPSKAREDRFQTESTIRRAIEEGGRSVVVLLQAGTLAPYWILRLRDEYPGVRWLDGGLAWSICHLPDLLSRNWGKIYHDEIVATHARLPGGTPALSKNVDHSVARAMAARPETAGESPVAFVEEKNPDLERVRELLAIPAAENQWSNRGPLNEALGRAYHEHLGLESDQKVVPCANGGMALEAMARLHDVRAGRPMRWVVSAFSFRNLGRGYFRDAHILDCDDHGMLSLTELRRLPPDSFDGIIVTNPFGLAEGFDEYEAFARRSGKALLIDNAAGVRPGLPSARFQALSLHHTKPYGVGEGGLAVVPAADAEAVFALLDYRALDDRQAEAWLANGKLSEIACAFHLDRLERSPQWLPRYEMQSIRMSFVCERAGLTGLLPGAGHVATSLPVLADHPISAEQLANPQLVLGKYYLPLAPLPNVTSIYERMINVPAHPDVARIDTEQLVRLLRDLTSDA